MLTQKNVNSKKLSIFFNKSFYIYFHSISPKFPSVMVARAVLEIGNSENDIKIYNTPEELSTNYKGKVSIFDGGKFLHFNFVTEQTDEKNLDMIFRIGPDKVYPIAIGGYLNIDQRDAIILGTLVLEYNPSVLKTNMKPAYLIPGTPLFKEVNPNIIRFLQNKSNNYIHLPTRAIFDYEHFDEFFLKQKAKISKKKKLLKNVFISYPMSNLDNNQFSEIHDTVFKIAQILRQHNCNVFFAGENYQTKQDFHAASVSVLTDLSELSRADSFILLYPKQTVTSSLIELGWALSQNKQCIVFYNVNVDLPFILKGLINSIEYNVKAIDYTDKEHLLPFIDSHFERIFGTN